MLKFAFFIVTAIAILFCLVVAFMVFTDESNSFSKKMWFYTAKCDAFPTFQNATEIAEQYGGEIEDVSIMIEVRNVSKCKGKSYFQIQAGVPAKLNERIGTNFHGVPFLVTNV